MIVSRMAVGVWRIAVAACLGAATALAADPEAEKPAVLSKEVREALGGIFGATVTVKEITLPKEGCFLHIHKLGQNGESKPEPHPLGPCKQLTLVIAQGKGLGVSPRQEDGPEGMQVRILAKGRTEGHVFSVSYTIPDGSAQASQIDGSGEILFHRVDLDAQRKQLGYLKIWTSEAAKE